MNAKDLKAGDIIRLHKSTLERLYLSSPSYIGLVERKAGAKVIVWFFTHGVTTKVRRKTIGVNTAVAHVMEDNVKSYHQRMVLAKYFENDLSNEVRNTPIKFGN